MERIDLAHAAEFRLGRLTARPPLRQLVRDDGAEEVLEPRVMQVLVALARADGGIVGRDDLTAACWDGRVVGEDAINRVISRLRRSAEGIGEGSFRIETITKVGYRLVRTEAADTPTAAPVPPAASETTEAKRLRLDRRAMLVGSGTAVAGAAAWLGYRRFVAPSFDPSPPPEVRALMEQAMIATQQGTPEGRAQAQGLMRRVVELRPDYPDGWGLLALIYAAGVGTGPPNVEADMRARSEDAIKRAYAIDSDNAYATVARGLLNPRGPRWLSGEHTLRDALRRHPGNQMLLASLAGIMLSVGRCRESAELTGRALACGPPSPALVYSNVQALWAAGRLDEADRAMDSAFALYPTHFAVWFTRYYFLMYTGRAPEALAMSANSYGRPTGIPEFNFETIDAVARAMISRKEADIDAAMRLNMDAAHKGRGYAENTLQFASALGRVDTAFEVANAYYFDRGFVIPEVRFTPEQRVYQRRGNFRTQFLFYPSTAAMRADLRFEALVREVGLVRYWFESERQPDYKRS